jgi:hypothetical protein
MTENEQNASPTKKPRRKLTEAEALSILHSTKTQREIAKEHGIQQPMVSDIKSGRRWGHLQPGKTYVPKHYPKDARTTEVASDTGDKQETV